MIDDSIVEKGRIKIVRTQAPFLACDGHAGGGVRVRNAGYVVSRGVYAAVNQHARWIDEMLGFLNDISLNVDFN
jgi:hypothetical protein